MELNQIIAFNLKTLRMERNLSLGQLSELIDVSKTMLSDIERGKGNPTINTIWKIANGLKVPYTRLMEGMDTEATLIRKEETPVQTGETPAYRVSCYYPSTPVRNFELFSVELDGQSSNKSIGHSEKAQEYIYVTTGELVVELESTEHTLKAGDSISFDSSISHTYTNKQKETTSFMVINFYPTA